MKILVRRYIYKIYQAVLNRGAEVVELQEYDNNRFFIKLQWICRVDAPIWEEWPVERTFFFPDMRGENVISD